jgi:hypothetical protein
LPTNLISKSQTAPVRKTLGVTLDERMKQTFEKYKQLIPTLVLTIICASTVIQFIQKTPIVDASGENAWVIPAAKHYAAFIAVTACLIIFFAYRPIYKYVLGVTLALGLFTLLNFNVVDTVYSFGINSLQLSFQPTSLYIIILTVLINLNRLKKTSDGGVQVIQPASNSSQERLNKEIENFKEKYKTRTSDELTQILADKRFTQSALEAARQILDDRKVEQ